MSVAASSSPWIERQLKQLLAQRGHAWLLHGPGGQGQYVLALELARAWLCEEGKSDGACGQCPSCHAVDVATHADLCVLMPETQLLEMGWPLGEKAQTEIDDKKRKPSKEIRVDAMRAAVEFTQRSNARGKGKVVLIFPAESMNAIAANALLKTLEEPSGDVKFVLATESSHQLLATIRSRCISHAMEWPEDQEALQWLDAQGLEPDFLRSAYFASGGRPYQAVAMAKLGWGTEQWSSFPQWMAHGRADAVKDLSIPEIVDAQQKLCHDLWTVQVGTKPRYFLGDSLAGIRPVASQLAHWSQSLLHQRRTMDHPFNEGLMREMLVGQAKSVLNSAS